MVTIVVGTLLLLTPKASVQGLDFLDALFMAVSATCVTGLTVVSTEHDLTRLGQFIVMLLFQIGGLGTMTFAIGISGIFNEGLSFNDKVIISKALNSKNLSNIKKVLLSTFIFAFSIESFGILYFFFQMPKVAGQSLLDQFFHSAFHTISAFCNAGFSLNDSSVSSTVWNNSISLLGATGFLIVLGGLGFPVLLNIYAFIKKREKLSLHSKVVLLYSSAFLIIGALGVYLLEFNNYFANNDTSFSVLNSIFTSITSRTAGFNSIDFGALNDSTLFLICGLMFIGGAPMSTAGGLKVTTFAVAFSHLYARVRKIKDPIFFERSISKKNISDSLNIISLSLFAVFVAVFFMSVLESDKEFIEVFFEAFSALATVGLSTGITAELSSFSKIVLCVLMFLGRVNILVFLDAVIRNSKKTKLQYLEEEIVL